MARASLEKAIRPARIARLFARCELKQLCCYRNPDFSVKMTDVIEHSDRDVITPQKNNNKKRENRGGHMIKCLLTELRSGRQENFRHSVRSVRHDQVPNVFPSSPPTQSISIYYITYT